MSGRGLLLFTFLTLTHGPASSLAGQAARAGALVGHLSARWLSRRSASLRASLAP